MGRGAQVCPDCRAADMKGRCERCGGEKPAGRGRRLCDGCEPEQWQEPGPTPCVKCGGQEDKRPGKRYCDPCREARDWELQRKRAARKKAARKPCRGCGASRANSDPRHVYCDRCRAEREVRLCPDCGDREVPKFRRLCDRCRFERQEESKARKNERARRLRLETPLEARRQRDARARARARRRKPKREAARGPTVPSLPLALAILAEVARDEVGNLWGQDFPEGNDGQIGVVCERVGVHDRRLRAWRVGESPGVSLLKADEVLTALGRFWWEVWTEETVRLPLLEAVSYSFEVKGGKVRRVRRRARRYGDAGPDLETLEAVRRLWEG